MHTPDYIWRALTKMSKFDSFLTYLYSSHLKNTFPKGIEQNLFQGEIRAILPENLVSRGFESCVNIFFNTVIYVAMSMHKIMDNV